MTGSGGPDEVPAAAQHVTAAAGFAYGVVGADIHVFGDGTPVYVLENWRPKPVVDDTWLRELPSRMLNARFALVDFTGRGDALAQLHQWRQQGGRFAVRWLHGPGGVGKTRLAAQFAADSAMAGWKVVTAVHGPGSVLPPPGSQDLRLNAAVGVLVIVDYADRWPLNHLTWLFSNALLHQVAVPARVLLIGRTADAWPRVRGVLANVQAGTSSQRLDLLPDGDEGRLDMFNAARDGFAERYQIGEPDVVDPPGPLDQPGMGLTLALHMAALVAVDAHVTGSRPPKDIAGLTVYLLDREHAHWANLHADPIHHTPPEVMNQMVFTASLTGAVPRPAGLAILAGVGVPGTPVQVLTDHAACYPPAFAGQDLVLEPLYPDRLAEDFLALTMPGHPADYPAQSWAPGSATRLLLGNGHQHPPDRYLSRSITFLAAATDRWPHLGHTYLYPLLRREPRLAIDAGGAALSTLAAISGIDVVVLEAIDALLPTGRHVDLDVAAAAISTILMPTRLAATGDESGQARLYTAHAWRLANAGRREQAIAPAEEAVHIRRRLVRADPIAYLPDLALSLNNLGRFLAEVGRHEDALAPATEAAGIYQRLAADDAARYLPDLAMSLNNLGAHLSALGRRHDALAPTEEAVDARQRLAAADPATYLPDLAMSLNNLGKMLSELGRREDATAPTQEAADIYRRLAAADPAAYLPDLATVCTNLAIGLSELGRLADAVAPAEEAVAIRRRLAEANQAAYLPHLAISLNNLGLRLAKLARRDEALARTEEAVAIRRRLAEANQAANLPDLAMSLNNLGSRLAEVGRRGDALVAAQEATGILRRLVADTPAAYLPHLATSLSNLGARLAEVGRREDALVPAQEATGILRHLVADTPAAYLPLLAASLSNLGVRFADVGRPDDALALVEEAVIIRRRLAQDTPAAHLPDLAASLTDLGKVLWEADRPQDAATATQEATGIYRSLDTGTQAAHLPDLALSLTNLGAQLSAVGRLDEALARTEEAVAIRRRLVEANPAAYLPDLAASLTNLGVRLAEVSRTEEALAPAEEAADIYRSLVPALPTAYLPDLATSLNNLGVHLVAEGRYEAARVAAEEALAVYEPLAEQWHDVFGDDRRRTRRLLAYILDVLGGDHH